MSNLKLPTMTFESLSKRFDKKPIITLAYATTAEFVGGTMGGADDFIIIYHHGSVIAQIGAESVWITNAGWSSMTTLSRLHKIANDNGLPITVSRRDWVATVLERGTLKALYSFESIGNCIGFTKNHNGWVTDRAY